MTFMNIAGRIVYFALGFAAAAAIIFHNLAK